MFASMEVSVYVYTCVCALMHLCSWVYACTYVSPMEMSIFINCYDKSKTNKKVIHRPFGSEVISGLPPFQGNWGLAFVATCCAPAKLAAWYYCSNFILFWFLWGPQRIIERFIIIQQLACLPLSSPPDQNTRSLCPVPVKLIFGRHLPH